MIAQAQFTGIVVNELILTPNEDGVQNLTVSVLVKKPHREPQVFNLSIRNNDAINLKGKVKKGDLVYFLTEPYNNLSKNDKTKYNQGFRIEFYEVLKKGERVND
jgi:hypothetical protein